MSIHLTRLRRSLSLRLTVMVFFLQSIVITIFVFAIHHEGYELMKEAFDDSIQGNAEALATLITDDDDDKNKNNVIRIEFADEIMRRFSHSDNPDLFAIIHPDGAIIEKSRMLMALPSEVIDNKREKEHFDFTFSGNPYRGIVIKIKRLPEDVSVIPQSLTVFYGTSALPLITEKNELIVLLFSMTGLCLVISALLAYLATRLGLRPLRRVAKDVSHIREDSLDRRLSSDAVPSELSEISLAINLFLERMEKSFERERRFSTDAAHELRTPIATLKSGVQAALLRLHAQDDVRHTLEEQLIDIERLEQLCNSLLLAVRGNGVFNDKALLTTQEWLDSIHDSVDALKSQAEANQAKVMIDIPALPEGYKLHCDGFSTSRIVTNLVSNSLQYGGSGVSIRLWTDWEADSVTLCVEDNGPGIPSHDISRLFERFYRGDASRVHAAGGFGLGLPICKTLAETFDGDIYYEHVESGGSRFLWRILLAKTRDGNMGNRREGAST